MESPLLRLPGAVPAEGPDAGVAAHYGDPLGEQRALAQAAGLVDRSHRGIVRVTGPDRLSWLNSLTTQQLEPLPPGSVVQALILSPNGHVEHHLTLTDDGEAVWAHVEPGTAAELVKFLESMRFMLRVEPADVSGEYALLTLMGPDAPQVPRVTAALPGDLGTDLIVPRDQVAALAAELRQAGARMAGMWAYEALRIAAHQPRLGLDTDHRTIPHEAGWIETAVHLDKGCYRGQETVARVHNLGHPPRRLVFLQLDGSSDRLPRARRPGRARRGHGRVRRVRRPALRARADRAGDGEADRAGRQAAAGRRRGRRPGDHRRSGRGRQRQGHAAAACQARAPGRGCAAPSRVA